MLIVENKKVRKSSVRYLHEKRLYDLLILLPILFSGISYFFLPFIWIAKLEIKKAYVTNENLISNSGIIQNETNSILIIMKDLDFQLGLLILSGLIILLSLFQARFHPRKTGLFLIIFAILRVDEFIRFQGQIQYSSHGAGTAIMFLSDATAYNLNVNPVYLILQICIHISLVFAGLFLLFVPLTKFRKEITQVSELRFNIKNLKENLIQNVIAFFPFFGIFSISLLGMIIAANLMLLSLKWNFTFIIIYIIFIILITSFFMGIIFLTKRIIEPVYPQTRARKVTEYVISSAFLFLISIFNIFFWADQFDSLSLTLSLILDNIFGIIGISPESKFALSTLNYLFVFIIPLSLAALSLYILLKRKMKKKDEEKQENKLFNFAKQNKKLHTAILLLLLFTFGLPTNLLFQGSDIFVGLTITNASTSDSFGLNWNSSTAIQIMDVEIFSNSSFRININFSHNYHNIPLFLRQDFICVNQFIVDSDNDSFFDSRWNFSYLEIEPSVNSYEFRVSNDTRGYYFYLKNSGVYFITGRLNESVIIDQEITFFLSYKTHSEEDEFLVLSNTISTSVEI